MARNVGEKSRVSGSGCSSCEKPDPVDAACVTLVVVGQPCRSLKHAWHFWPGAISLLPQKTDMISCTQTCYPLHKVDLCVGGFHGQTSIRR